MSSLVNRPVGWYGQRQARSRCSGLGGLGHRGLQLQTLKQPLVRQVCERSRPGTVVARRSGAVAERPVADAPQKGLQKPGVADAHRDLMQKKTETDAAVRRIWAQLGRTQRETVDLFKLLPASTKLTDGSGRAMFSSVDGGMCFDVQAHQGLDSPVMWINSPRAMLGQLAIGGRVNAYVSTSHSYAPNLDIELYHYPLSGKLFMYLNLVPRRSLIEHPKDLKLFYLDTEASSGATYQALYESCEEKVKSAADGWERYVSRDAYVRALTGGTCLMYQMDASEDNLAEVESMVQQVHSIWAALVSSEEIAKPQEPCQVEALERTDRNLLAYSSHDPDIEKASMFLGDQGLADMLALLAREDRIF